MFLLIKESKTINILLFFHNSKSVNSNNNLISIKTLNDEIFFEHFCTKIFNFSFDWQIKITLKKRINLSLSSIFIFEDPRLFIIRNYLN